MEIDLVVIRPFSGLARGDIIAGASWVAEVLSTEHAQDVVRVLKPSKEN